MDRPCMQIRPARHIWWLQRSPPPLPWEAKKSTLEAWAASIHLPTLLTYHMFSQPLISYAIRGIFLFTLLHYFLLRVWIATMSCYTINLWKHWLMIDRPMVMTNHLHDSSCICGSKCTVPVPWFDIGDLVVTTYQVNFCPRFMMA
jgi:hypothetical protein